jgi:hypothetical protein
VCGCLIAGRGACWTVDTAFVKLPSSSKYSLYRYVYF